MTKLNRRKRSSYPTELPPPIDFGTAAGALAVSIFLIGGGVFAVNWGAERYYEEFYRPLTELGPVIRLNYAHFALPGLVLGAITLPLTIGLGLLARPLRISPPYYYRALEVLTWATALALALMIALPIALGGSARLYIESLGYQECDRLFIFRVGRLERGYVKSPELCVPPEKLKRAVRAYEAKQRESAAGRGPP